MNCFFFLIIINPSYNNLVHLILGGDESAVGKLVHLGCIFPRCDTKKIAKYFKALCLNMFQACSWYCNASRLHSILTPVLLTMFWSANPVWCLKQNVNEGRCLINNIFSCICEWVCFVNPNHLTYFISLIELNFISLLIWSRGTSFWGTFLNTQISGNIVWFYD